MKWALVLESRCAQWKPIKKEIPSKCLRRYVLLEQCGKWHGIEYGGVGIRILFYTIGGNSSDEC